MAWIVERRPRVARLVGTAIGGLALALVLGVVAWGAGGDVGVVAGAALVVLAASPTVARLAVDRLDGPGVYAALSALFFGPFSLGWLGGPPVHPAPNIGQVDVARALVLVAAALAAFGAGAFAAGPPTARPRIVISEHVPVPTWTLLGLVSIGVVGLAAGLGLGAIGIAGDAGVSSGVQAYAQGFQQLSLLGALTALALALWTYNRKDRRLRWLLAAVVAVQAIGGFATGYKQNALFPVIFVGIGYVMCRGRIPWRAIVATVVIAAVVLLPATVFYRAVLRSHANEGGGGLRSPTALVKSTTDYLDLRFRLIDHVALIRARTPSDYPYGDGRRYITLPALVVVPRVLWPSKPILDDGAEFSHSYWQVPLNIDTSTPLTQPGDLYRNFGLVGVLLGMAIWGAFVGVVTSWSRRSVSPRRAMAYGVALVTTFAFVESDLPQLLTSSARTILVACAVAWLVLPGSRGSCGVTVITRMVTLRRIGRNTEGKTWRRTPT